MTAPWINNKYEQKAREILTRKGYILNYETLFTHEGKVHSMMQHYSGPKGAMIVQIWADGSGFHTYTDWGLGNRWDQLEAIL